MKYFMSCGCFLLVSVSASLAYGQFLERISYGDPVACFVTFGEYEGDIDDLGDTVVSSSHLAEALMKCGYQVTFITGQADVANLPDSLESSENSTIHLVSTGTEVNQLLSDWTTVNFRSRSKPAPFGFVVFNAHGEARDMKQYILAPDENPGSASICVSDYSQRFANEFLPIYFVINACRTEIPSPEPFMLTSSRTDSLALTAYKELRGSMWRYGSRASSVLESPELTHMYAGAQGQAVDSSKANLIALLAQGLGFHGSKTFVARVPVAKKDVMPESELSIARWFDYARMQFPSHGETELQRQFVIKDGFYDSKFIIASRNPSFRYRPPVRDIARLLKSATPDTAVSSSKAGRGVEVTRKRTNGEFWDTMEVLPQNSRDASVVARDLSAYRRFAAVELWAEPSKGAKLGRHDRLSFELHFAKRVGAETKYLNHHTQQISIEYRKPVWIKIPLVNASPSDFVELVSVSTPVKNHFGWPAEHSVTLRTLMIGSERELELLTKKVNAEQSYPTHDVIARWWIGDSRFSADANRMIWSYPNPKPDRSRPMNVVFGDMANQSGVAIGGPISPAVFVGERSHDLMIRFEDFESRNPLQNEDRINLTVYMVANGAPVCHETRTITRSKLRRGERFPVSGYGMADYFLILSDAAQIDFASIELIPRDR